MRSWKTTLLGVGTMLAVVGAALKAAFDGDPATVVEYGPLAAGLTAGIGLVFARDNDRSSEDVGVN